MCDIRGERREKSEEFWVSGLNEWGSLKRVSGFYRKMKIPVLNVGILSCLSNI